MVLLFAQFATVTTVPRAAKQVLVNPFTKFLMVLLISSSNAWVGHSCARRLGPLQSVMTTGNVPIASMHRLVDRGDMKFTEVMSVGKSGPQSHCWEISPAKHGVNMTEVFNRFVMQRSPGTDRITTRVKVIGVWDDTMTICKKQNTNLSLTLNSAIAADLGTEIGE